MSLERHTTIRQTWHASNPNSRHWSATRPRQLYLQSIVCREPRPRRATGLHAHSLSRTHDRNPQQRYCCAPGYSLANASHSNNWHTFPAFTWAVPLRTRCTARYTQRRRSFPRVHQRRSACSCTPRRSAQRVGQAVEQSLRRLRAEHRCEIVLWCFEEPHDGSEQVSKGEEDRCDQEHEESLHDSGLQDNDNAKSQADYGESACGRICSNLTSIQYVLWVRSDDFANDGYGAATRVLPPFFLTVLAVLLGYCLTTFRSL